MTVGARDPLPPGLWKILCVAAIGSFMGQLDATIVNVSLGPLATRLHSTLATIQWVSSGYMLALALVLPVNGWLVGRIGARGVYLWSFGAFTLASALCGLAGSAASLIGFRLVQGAAAGLLAPMAQMLVSRAAGRQSGRVAGIITVPVLLAPMFGPALAGVLLSVASWRWLFLINVPVGALAIVLALALLPDDREDREPRRLDAGGLALLSPGLGLFLFGADHGGEATGRAALALAPVLIALYWRGARRKGDHALIDPGLLRVRVFTRAMAVNFLTNGAMFAGQMLVPLYLIHGCLLSSSRAGWLMLPLGLGMMCSFPLVGRLVERLGPRRLATGGAAIALVASLPLIWMARTGLDVPLLGASLFLRGAALGAISMPAFTAGYTAIAKSRLPVATTAMNIVQRLGPPVWTTLAAGFLSWRLSVGPAPSAYAAAFGLLCALHALLALAALRLPAAVPERPPG